MEMVGIGIGYVHSCPDVYSTYSGKSVLHNAQLFSTYQYSGCSLVMVVAHAISHHGYAVVGAHVRRLDGCCLHVGGIRSWLCPVIYFPFARSSYSVSSHHYTHSLLPLYHHYLHHGNCKESDKEIWCSMWKYVIVFGWNRNAMVYSYQLLGVVYQLS